MSEFESPLSGGLCTTETAFGYFCHLGRSPSTTDGISRSRSDDRAALTPLIHKGGRQGTSKVHHHHRVQLAEGAVHCEACCAPGKAG